MQKLQIPCICGLVITSSLAAAAGDTARITPVVKAVQQVMPSVVNISTEQMVQVSDPFALFFNDFFGRHLARYEKESNKSCRAS